MKLVSLEKLIFVCGCLILALGCESKRGPDYESLGLVAISGKVTLQGSPLANVEIRFEAPDTTYSYGVTDANGRYAMMFDSRTSGVIPGEKRVVILPKSSGTVVASGPVDGDDPDQKNSTVSTVPKAYGSKSMIRVSISESDSNVDFDLLSNGKTTGRRSN